MSYSKQDLFQKINSSVEKISLFYSRDFINYRGKTSDTCECFTEVVAEYLLRNIHLFDEIKMITRKYIYKTKSHDGKTALATSNREEERIALKMFGKKFNYIGQVIDYQIPLKSSTSDKGIGKIDLLSKNDNTLYLLELKKPDSTETMLRCVLEGYTYLKTVDQCKLLIDFDLPEDTIIKTAPLVFYGSAQYDEYIQCLPNLLKLMDILDCKPFFLCEYYDSYDVKIIHP